MKHFFQQHSTEIFEANRLLFWIFTAIFSLVSVVEYFFPDWIFFFVPPVFFITPLLISAGIFFLDPKKPKSKPLPLWFSVISFFFFSSAFGVLLWSKIIAENPFVRYGVWGSFLLFFSVFAAIVLFEESSLYRALDFWNQKRKIFFFFLGFLILLFGILLFGRMAIDPFFRPFS